MARKTDEMVEAPTQGKKSDIGKRVQILKQTYANEFSGKTGTVVEYHKFPMRPHWVTVEVDGKKMKFRDIDLKKSK